MVRFVLADEPPIPPPLNSDMEVKLAFKEDGFDELEFERLFEEVFRQLCAEPDGAIYMEEDQHERGLLYPHLPPIEGDGQEEGEDGLEFWANDVFAAVCMDGEGRTFISMDGGWAVRTKGWIGGHAAGADDLNDLHIIMTGEALLRAVVELRPNEWAPQGGVFRVVESSCPFWE